MNYMVLLHLNYSCDREGIRTPNPQSRNLIFYPIELRSQIPQWRKSFLFSLRQLSSNYI